jgi:hypothetical protein
MTSGHRLAITARRAQSRSNSCEADLFGRTWRISLMKILAAIGFGSALVLAPALALANDAAPADFGATAGQPDMTAPAKPTAKKHAAKKQRAAKKSAAPASDAPAPVAPYGASPKP